VQQRNVSCLQTRNWTCILWICRYRVNAGTGVKAMKRQSGGCDLMRTKLEIQSSPVILTCILFHSFCPVPFPWSASFVHQRPVSHSLLAVLTSYLSLLDKFTLPPRSTKFYPFSLLYCNSKTHTLYSTQDLVTCLIVQALQHTYPQVSLSNSNQICISLGNPSSSPNVLS
jgi:hypothetical protein